MTVLITSLLLPETYYAAIGEFLFRFSQLEYQFHELIWASLDLGNKKGRIITIGTDFNVLCSQLTTIAHTDHWVKHAKHRQEINSLIDNASKYSDLRNHLAHGGWHDDVDGKAVLLYMKKKKQRYMPDKNRSIDDKFILGQAQKLKSLNERAQKLRDDLHALRPSLLEKYQ